MWPCYSFGLQPPSTSAVYSLFRCKCGRSCLLCSRVGEPTTHDAHKSKHLKSATVLLTTSLHSLFSLQLFLLCQRKIWHYGPFVCYYPLSLSLLPESWLRECVCTRVCPAAVHKLRGVDPKAEVTYIFLDFVQCFYHTRVALSSAGKCSSCKPPPVGFGQNNCVSILQFFCKMKAILQMFH